MLPPAAESERLNMNKENYAGGDYMSVGIVVAAHGELASGFLSAIKLLAGNESRVQTAELRTGMEPLDFCDVVAEAIDVADEGDGVMVFVDLFGGTPSNSAARLLGKKHIEVIAGVNLPMLLECVMSKDVSLGDLKHQLLMAGAQATVDVRARMEEAAERTGEGEDDEDFV